MIMMRIIMNIFVIMITRGVKIIMKIKRMMDIILKVVKEKTGLIYQKA